MINLETGSTTQMDRADSTTEPVRETQTGKVGSTRRSKETWSVWQPIWTGHAHHVRRPSV